VEREKELEREIERLTAENAELQAKVTELEKIKDGLLALINEYNKDLNAATNLIGRTTATLKNAKAVKVSIKGDGMAMQFVPGEK
jgi:peptidoglycan hydrolase CwlO-like protein